MVAVIFIFLGAEAALWLALLPPNVKEPKGSYVWSSRKEIVDWVNGPAPASP